MTGWDLAESIATGFLLVVAVVLVIDLGKRALNRGMNDGEF